jgi:ferredoxin-NADP reductase
METTKIQKKQTDKINEMEKHNVKIQSIEHVTHDVLRITTEKPLQYNFSPGQATKIAINKEGWIDKKKPFTFTCLPEDNHLEFTIKTYPQHKNVTNELLQLKVNDELILHAVFGTIQYKGEGTFIAGGAGVTPFISIIRSLDSKGAIGNNRLIFANKKKEDIILEAEFKNILGDKFINILSDELVEGYANGRITTAFIKSNAVGTNKPFYICGPPPMMEAVEKQLDELQVDKNLVVKEVF